MTILRPSIPFQIFIIPVQSKQSAFDTFYFLLFFGWKNCPSSFSKKLKNIVTNSVVRPLGSFLLIYCAFYVESIERWSFFTYNQFRDKHCIFDIWRMEFNCAWHFLRAYIGNRCGFVDESKLNFFGCCCWKIVFFSVFMSR